MLNKLLDSGSTVSQLKAELDRSTRSVRRIAHRVANASTEPGDRFSAALREAQGKESVNLEEEMVSLAEEQIRHEATSKLLDHLGLDTLAEAKKRLHIDPLPNLGGRYEGLLRHAKAWEDGPADLHRWSVTRQEYEAARE